MTMPIIFRDDDPSFYATPAMLEALYRPIWERALPVCLSVIPEHYANIFVPWEPPPHLDPNVAPAYRGQERGFPISQNPELCNYLDGLVQQGLVEILLHGYSHLFHEFNSYDVPVLRDKLQRGRAELEKAFPHADITTFIAPYNAVTARSIDVILGEGLHFHMDSKDIPPTSPYKPEPRNRVSTLLHTGGGRFLISDTSDYGMNQPDEIRFPRFEGWLAQRADADAILVACHHYYMFYENFGAPKAAEFDLWNNLIAQLGEAEITTFNRVFAQN